MLPLVACMKTLPVTRWQAVVGREACALVDYRICKRHLLLSIRLFSVSLSLASFIAIVGCASSFYKEIDIRVTGGLLNEQDAVNVEARNARDFFRPLNLDFPDQLKVVFAQHNPSSEGPISIGRYNPADNIIFVLDYQSAVAASHLVPPAFGTPMNFDLWRSYLVHEIAHAVVEKNFTYDEDAIAPTEYIAAVAQLSTLPDDVFESILSNYRDVTAFKDESEITDLYYFMKPCEFAVKAYLHYSKSENGQSFIRQLLQEGLPGSGIRSEIPFF